MTPDGSLDRGFMYFPSLSNPKHLTLNIIGMYDDHQLQAQDKSMASLQQKVRTCWWFDGNGYEAAKFYCSIVPDSRIDAEFETQEAEEPLVVEFTLAGARCVAPFS